MVFTYPTKITTTTKQCIKNEGSGGLQDKHTHIHADGGHLFGVHYKLLKVEKTGRAQGCNSLTNQSEQAFRDT